MKTRSLYLLFFLFIANSVVLAYSQSDLDSLDYYLNNKQQFENIKLSRIESIHKAYYESEYKRYEDLFEEYASYNYDSAYLYVNRLLDESYILGDTNLIASAMMHKGFAYLSAGLFMESANIFQAIDITNCDSSVCKEYYMTYARLMYDLADYNRGELYFQYINRGNEYSRQALNYLTPSDTTDYWYVLAVMDMKQGNYVRSLERFSIQLKASDITEHERAISYSSMGYIYSALKDSENSSHYNILAAISDIRNSTKEAVALQNVAVALFEDGQTERAARYIRFALDDAQLYNARHRQIEIGHILPIIEQSQIDALAARNKRIRILSFITYALLLVLILSLAIVYNRIRAVQKAHTTIEKMNRTLKEANKIKEAYISTFLCNQVDTFNMLSLYQRYVKKCAAERRYDDLQTIPQQFNANRTRKELYKQFDEMVLQIFPGFVEQFNALLREEDRIIPAQDELLTTELRIYALIRLGVSDNEKIAQILDYSVNTIYTYKTRTKNRSNLTSDQFTQALFKIV